MSGWWNSRVGLAVRPLFMSSLRLPWCTYCYFGIAYFSKMRVSQGEELGHIIAPDVITLYFLTSWRPDHDNLTMVLHTFLANSTLKNSLDKFNRSKNTLSCSPTSIKSECPQSFISTQSISPLSSSTFSLSCHSLWAKVSWTSYKLLILLFNVGSVRSGGKGVVELAELPWSMVSDRAMRHESTWWVLLWCGPVRTLLGWETRKKKTKQKKGVFAEREKGLIRWQAEIVSSDLTLNGDWDWTSELWRVVSSFNTLDRRIVWKDFTLWYSQDLYCLSQKASTYLPLKIFLPQAPETFSLTWDPVNVTVGQAVRVVVSS